MFQIHDLVVYDNNGVYEVMDIGSLSFSKDQDKKYYTLRPKYSRVDSTEYVPVNSTRYIRKVMDETDAKKVINKIPEMKATVTNFKKNTALKDYYLEIMKSHDVERFLIALKEISMKEYYAKNNNKRLGQIDIEYKNRLLSILSQEFATIFSTDIESALNRLEESVRSEIQLAC